MTASVTVAGAAAPGTAGALTPSRAAGVRAGPVDHLHRDQILALLEEVPVWRRDTTPARRDHQRRVRGTQIILGWLLTHPGAGWQERWLASGADDGTGWISQIAAPRSTGRSEVCMGVNALLLCRVVLPGYRFIAAYHPTRPKDICRLWCPEVFARLPDAAATHGMDRAQQANGIHVITKIVLHTGKDIGQLTAGDLTGYRQWHHDTHGKRRVCAGYYAAWDLLRGIGVLPPGEPLQFAQRQGQASTTDMVDHYRISNPQIRGVLIRYLDERRPGLDYSTLRSLATALAGQFWADIERHHPGIATLHLPADVAQAWKQRLSFLTAKPGQPRKDTDNLLTAVRAFYLDIQEWALEDPSWAPWAVPSPVRKSDTAGRAKRKKNVTSQMHQRVRERLPHLPALAASADHHRTSQHAFLAAAKNTAVGETLEHGGVTYRRIASSNSLRQPARYPIPPALVKNTATGERTDVTRAEDDAFWTWAIIETLRHTGIRVEELLEITHLALISYRLPGTGELIPMLQIVPSKSNEERLLLVTPELASVLAAIITRLRGATGSVPLAARYDAHERLTGPPLPHLFQRSLGHGWRRQVISYATVHRMLGDALARAGLRDATGQPLHYTPHDFRRMFATETVTGGLPVHIAARLLGHHSLATTQAYLAVFQDDLVRSYQAFLSQRRAARPPAEYRQPTDEEWQEFQQHFELRKVALGTCGRPYSSPCRHEHAPLTEPNAMFEQVAACFR